MLLLAGRRIGFVLRFFIHVSIVVGGHWDREGLKKKLDKFPNFVQK
jgi:hypothetical protein